MGIPSYFSYIVKNHKRLLKQFIPKEIKIDNLYIDSNSLIYDSLFSIISEYSDNESFEKKLISMVNEQLENHICEINPSKNVIIAFDGIAPFAKLEQQRTRRYKSQFLESTSTIINPDKEKTPWNKSAITPGTVFMNKLNSEVGKYFRNKSRKLGVKNIIFSGSDEIGEGEHKIFEFIRENAEMHKHQTTVIHGLDADLIMLCLNHLHISDNIYLYRETPHYIKNISAELDPDNTYLVDIFELGKDIVEDLNNGREVDKQQKYNSIHDYIFICFMLGNDFLPHFPSVNIRTNGIDILVNTYKHVLGDSNENLTYNAKIKWKNLRKFVSYLSETEIDNLRSEYKIRDRIEKRELPKNTIEEKERYFNMLPTKEREIEKYINPFEYGWQQRYYKMLFDLEINDNRRQEICTNYLEGLEWNLAYYTNGCKNWEWKYCYNYPPLWQDLIKYVPYFDTTFVKEGVENTISTAVQLAYVLPRNSLELLPFKTRQKLLLEYNDVYRLDYKFRWSFCKYFWESHIDMPDLNIDKLKEIVST